MTPKEGRLLAKAHSAAAAAAAGGVPSEAARPAAGPDEAAAAAAAAAAATGAAALAAGTAAGSSEAAAATAPAASAAPAEAALAAGAAAGSGEAAAAAVAASEAPLEAALAASAAAGSGVAAPPAAAASAAMQAAAAEVELAFAAGFRGRIPITLCAAAGGRSHDGTHIFGTTTRGVRRACPQAAAAAAWDPNKQPHRPALKRKAAAAAGSARKNKAFSSRLRELVLQGNLLADPEPDPKPSSSVGWRDGAKGARLTDTRTYQPSPATTAAGEEEGSRQQRRAAEDAPPAQQQQQQLEFSIDTTPSAAVMGTSSSCHQGGAAVVVRSTQRVAAQLSSVLKLRIWGSAARDGDGGIGICEQSLLKQARAGGYMCDGNRHAPAIAQLQEMLSSFGLSPVSGPIALYQLLMLVGSTWTNKQLLTHLMAGAPHRGLFDPAQLGLYNRVAHLTAQSAVRLALACDAASSEAKKEAKAWWEQHEAAAAAAAGGRKQGEAAVSPAVAAGGGDGKGNSPSSSSSSGIVVWEDDDACATASSNDSSDMGGNGVFLDWANDDGMNVLSYCIIGGEPEVRCLPSTFAVQLQKAWREGSTDLLKAEVTLAFGRLLCADGHAGGNIAKYERVMCPWNTGSNHWVVLEVRPRAGTAVVYDPMSTNSLKQRLRKRESLLLSQVLEPVRLWQQQEQEQSRMTAEEQRQRLSKVMPKRTRYQSYMRGPAPPGVPAHEWGSKSCQVPAVLPQLDVTSCGPLALGNMFSIVSFGRPLQPDDTFDLECVQQMVLLLVKGTVAVGCMLSSQQQQGFKAAAV